MNTLLSMSGCLGTHSIGLKMAVIARNTTTIQRHSAIIALLSLTPFHKAAGKHTCK